VRKKGREEKQIESVSIKNLPGGLDGGDEELGAVRVGASVGHGEEARRGVLEREGGKEGGREGGRVRKDKFESKGTTGRGLTCLKNKIFVREGASVDGLPAGAVAAGDVAALQHEVRNHAVERTALISEASLARGDLTEVLCKLGVRIE